MGLLLSKMDENTVSRRIKLPSLCTAEENKPYSLKDLTVSWSSHRNDNSESFS